MSVATAAERVERILSVLPWIVDTPGSTVEQVCNRFGLQERELRADLDLLMYEVGIHPFTPDARVDVIYEEDRIYIHLGDYFRRPLRLTSDEAIVLYTAGRAVLDRPDPDPVLTSAVAKLERVLGEDVATRIDIRLGDADPDVFSTVRDATDEGHRLTIDYYSFGRDERSERDVDPVSLSAHEGHWYLSAWCHNAGDIRRFRLDRIAHAVDTGRRVLDHEGARGGSDEVEPDLSDAPSAVLTVERAEAWLTDAFPTESIEELPDGRIRMVVRVAAEPWLKRLLLRLGPSVEATDGSTGADLSPLGAEAAAQVLKRYE